MVQLPSKTLTVNEFINSFVDNYNYELIDGELIDLEPTGIHEQIAAFLGRKLNVEIERETLDYSISHSYEVQ